MVSASIVIARNVADAAIGNVSGQPEIVWRHGRPGWYRGQALSSEPAASAGQADGAAQAGLASYERRGAAGATKAE